MKFKLIIGITIITGLGLGIFFGLSKMPHHSESNHNHSETSHNNSSHQKTSSTQLSSKTRGEVDRSFGLYFEIQEALSSDNLKNAKKAAGNLKSSLTKWSNTELNQITKALENTASNIETATNIKTARDAFEKLSATIDQLVTKVGPPEKIEVGKYYCPMANQNKGAYWFQKSEGTQNPYYGSAMLKCGTKQEMP